MGDDFGYGTCESTAQVLLALTSMGIDPLSDDFGTVNMNMITNLTGYIQSDNGFHIPCQFQNPAKCLQYRHFRHWILTDVL